MREIEVTNKEDRGRERGGKQGPGKIKEGNLLMRRPLGRDVKVDHDNHGISRDDKGCKAPARGNDNAEGKVVRRKPTAIKSVENSSLVPSAATRASKDVRGVPFSAKVVMLELITVGLLNGKYVGPGEKSAQ